MHRVRITIWLYQSRAYQSKTTVYVLYPPVRVWYQKLGVYNLLDRQYNAILYAKTNGCSVRELACARYDTSRRLTQSSPQPCLHIRPT